MAPPSQELEPPINPERFSRTKISRATMKSLLLEGLGRVDFYYPNSKPKKKTASSQTSRKGRVDRLQARRETQR